MSKHKSLVISRLLLEDYTGMSGDCIKCDRCKKLCQDPIVIEGQNTNLILCESCAKVFAEELLNFVKGGNKNA
jgi:MinD superfamily P-loop ATPase